MLKMVSTREAVTASTSDAPFDPASQGTSAAQISGRKYLQRSGGPQLRSRRSGFSLIEVVIALGVFVFGALAIVRIFPGSIAAIQSSEQRNVGQRMAQTTLARYTISPLSVPEAIADVSPDTGIYDATTNETGWSDFAGSAYGSATRNESLPRSAPAPDDISFDNSATVSTQLANSAAGHFRRIVGEEHVVEEENVGGTLRGVITLRYPYLFFVPPAVLPIKPETIAVHQLRLYQNFPVQGVTINKLGELDFSNASSPEYTGATGAPDVNDTGDRKRPNANLRIALAPGTMDREKATFYVSYRWRDSSGNIQAVTDEAKRFPSNGSWTTGTAGPPAQVLMGRLANQVVEGPVQVKLKFSPPVTGTQTVIGQNLGRIVFDDNKLVGQKIGVEYSVPDWRMIVHDDNLSTTLSTDDQSFLGEQDPAYTFGSGGKVSNARATTVPTRFITDDTLSENATLTARPSQVYALVKGTRATATTPVKTEVAASIAEWSPDKFPNGSSMNYTAAPAANTPRVLGVRRKPGQVFFDVGNLAAPSSRVVYRNVDGWIQQPSVAARSYIRYVDRSLVTTATERVFWPREPWREYVWNTADDALYFHPSETGKTVLATYQYQVGTGPTAVTTTMRDVPLTIRENLVDQPIKTGPFADFALKPNADLAKPQAARAYFVDDAGRCLGTQAQGDTDVTSTAGTATASAKIISIQSIRGASVRVRSAWFDGNRYSQTDVAGYRSLDVESNTRS